MQQPPWPAALATDSIEALVSAHSRRSVAVYLSVLLLTALALALLPLVRVSISVQGRGLVRPATEKHEISAAAAGYVAMVRTGRGHPARVGDTLLLLEDRATRGRTDLLRHQIADREREVLDLERLTAAAWHPEPPGALRTTRYRQAAAQLGRELEAARLRTTRTERALERAQALFARGVVPVAEVESQEHRRAELLVEEGLLTERYRTQWQSELASAREQLRQMQGEMEQLLEEGGRSVVRSPVTGTVEELASLSPGSFLHAGERIATISPSSPLAAEVYVAPRDIGHIRPGTPARLQVDAFHYTDWGFLPGRVVEVPSDFVLLEQQPVFRVRVQLDRTYLRLPSGHRGELKKGMTLTARFPVARRSLWQLLRDDAADWLDPAHTPPPTR